MSWYPGHHDEDVIGVTVGSTGPTGTVTGDTGETGPSAAGNTGPTGVTGTTSDLFMDYSYQTAAANRTDGTVIVTNGRVSSQQESQAGAENIRSRNAGTEGKYEILTTGIYRLHVTVPISRASATADRSSMLRVTWGRYNTTNPLDDVLMQWYGGVIDSTGGDQIDGIWMGTLTEGETYGLWQETSGEGNIASPAGANTVVLLEWVRAS
jgi:hypothetical protein